MPTLRRHRSTAAALLAATRTLASALTAQAPPPRAVRVTGASAGIGRTIAERLARRK